MDIRLDCYSQIENAQSQKHKSQREWIGRLKKTHLCTLLIVVLLSCVACAQPVTGEVIRSDKERVATPDVSQANLNTLVDGSCAFR